MASCQLPIWAQYLQALSIPLLGIFGGYIAWRQWVTAHEKVKLDLFDRRLAAYEQLKDAVAPVNASGKVSNVDTDHFARAMRDMRFLFDKDMEKFVGGIFQAMLDKYVIDAQGPAKDKKSGELFSRITNGIYTEMPERMERFMRFRRPSSF